MTTTAIDEVTILTQSQVEDIDITQLKSLQWKSPSPAPLSSNQKLMNTSQSSQAAAQAAGINLAKSRPSSQSTTTNKRNLHTPVHDHIMPQSAQNSPNQRIDLNYKQQFEEQQEKQEKQEQQEKEKEKASGDRSRETYESIERRFADTMNLINRAGAENADLDINIDVDSSADLDLARVKSRLYQQTVEELESEKNHLRELMSKQEAFYELYIVDLQRKVSQLESEHAEGSASVALRKLSPGLGLITSTSNGVSGTVCGDDGGNGFGGFGFASSGAGHITRLDEKGLLERHEKLMRDYRMLANQFEVEKSSKLVLMDQIELLAHKNEDLINQFSLSEDSIGGAGGAGIEGRNRQSIANTSTTTNTTTTTTTTTNNDILEEFHHSTDSVIRTSGIIQRAHQVNSNEDGRLGNSEGDDKLAYYSHESFDQLPHGDSSLNSFKVNTNFQFPPTSSAILPPSPDPESRNLKRQSLPASYNTTNNSNNNNYNSLKLEKLNSETNSKFVLSPFKLAPSNAKTSATGGESPEAVFEDFNSVKRYSSSKPTHVRYNSHDILPIKVEFEDQTSTRVASMPEKSKRQLLLVVFNKIDESLDEDYIKSYHRNGTLNALNGFSEEGEEAGEDESLDHGRSKRFSYEEFDLSSKRSSYLNNLNNYNSQTRQEITKLKFELQSLKLHNDKLLSYIGFELQKQKKNLRKLAKKQSENSLRQANMYEYSDAKLIQDSRDLLINKKRVLRSVSINAVYNNDGKINNQDRAHVKKQLGISKLGLIDEGRGRAGTSTVADYNLDNIRDIDGVDDIDGGIDDFDDGDDGDDYEEEEGDIDLDMDDVVGVDGRFANDKYIKKFASQVFARSKLHSLSEDENDLDFDNDDNNSNSSWQLQAADDDEGQEQEQEQEENGDGDENVEAGQRGRSLDNYASSSSSSSSSSSVSTSSEEELGMLNQIRHLVLGKETKSKSRGKGKSRQKEDLVDDNLKFKFLTIALGIMIIGFKLTPHGQNAK